MSNAPSADVDAVLAEVRQQQKIDEMNRHVDRLTRHGAKYFNLNPFEVLELSITCEEEEVKKKYRALSTMLHPDKNPHEKASEAFDVLRGAYGTLIDEAKRRECREIAQEAKRRLDEQWTAIYTRKRARGEGGTTLCPTPNEADPTYAEELRKYVLKLFAEIARKNIEREHRARETARADKEKEAHQIAVDKAQNEWNKNWEAGRDVRVQGWRSFVGKKTGGSSSLSSTSASTSASASASSTSTSASASASSPSPSTAVKRPAPDVAPVDARALQEGAVTTSMAARAAQDPTATANPLLMKNPAAIDYSHPTQTFRVGFKPPRLNPESRPASASQFNPATSTTKY
eukprot:TRINITY_DN12_c0_g1_i4.p1 TRINITY_DN12_c0_g1~~TRINITY_DN12_c0_g1_i4.p1  ORF type:complete len:345 (+),score=87.89 TRINITY_DN12_c0_g1_i4:57-1091(+)